MVGDGVEAVSTTQNDPTLFQLVLTDRRHGLTDRQTDTNYNTTTATTRVSQYQKKHSSTHLPYLGFYGARGR